MPANSNNSLLVVISSPSGGGKDSVIRALLKIFPESARLVTTTSRPPRPGNVDGVDYHFINKEQFEQKIKDNKMLEYNVYSGNYYGIEKSRLHESLASHPLILTQIEVNGKNSLDKAGIPHLSIFLLPDNLDNLRVRVKQRGGLNNSEIEKRLETAKSEIAASEHYDFRLTNKEGQLAQTIEQVNQIIQNALQNGLGIDKK